MTVDDANIAFPNIGLRVLSAVVHFVGTAVLAGCLSRRLAFEDLGTLRGWRSLSVARIAVILIFADSLAFLMLTGILIHGVGLELSNASCSLAIFSCIALYTSSKILIYIFLSEKVWLVWSNMSSSKTAVLAQVDEAQQWGEPQIAAAPPLLIVRSVTALGRRLRSSPVYFVCFASVLLYIVCFVLLLVYRIAYRRTSDGECVIGLERKASIPLLTYDVYITVLLTGLFVWPLRSNRVMSHRLRRLATRTLYASFVALATSAVNIAVLTSLRGHELGWLCLASCGADVMINALVLDFVTESRLKRYIRHSRTRPKYAIGAAEGMSTGATPPDPDDSDPAAGTRSGTKMSVMRAIRTKTGTVRDHLAPGTGTTHSIELRGVSISNSTRSSEPRRMSSSKHDAKKATDLHVLGHDGVRRPSPVLLVTPDGDDEYHKARRSGSVSTLGSAAKAGSSIGHDVPPSAYRFPPPSSSRSRAGHSQPRSSSEAHELDGEHDVESQAHELNDEDLYDSDSLFEFDEPTPTATSERHSTNHSSPQPRLLSFAEAIQQVDPFSLHPRSSSWSYGAGSSKRPRGTRSWRRPHYLPTLTPMQPPPGTPAGAYLGTSRRMSMPLSPDDIDLEDFSHPGSSSGITWGARSRSMIPSSSTGSRRSKKDRETGPADDQRPLPLPAHLPASSLDKEKGKASHHSSQDHHSLFGTFSFPPRRPSLPMSDLRFASPPTKEEKPEGPLDRRQGDTGGPLLPTFHPP